MTTRLDPSRPLLWRSPHCLQVGVDEPVVLDRVSTGTEQVVAALQAGFPGEVEGRLAAAFSIGTTEFHRVMTALAPAIHRDGGSPAPLGTTGRCRIAIDGVGPTAERLRDILAGERAVRVVEPDRASHTGGVDLTILCADFVLPPSRYARWLRDDVPHLPIVLGDRVVTIGPFVTPGEGPCLHCVDLHRTDEDPAWPALASQLLGRPSPLDDLLLSSEIAARSARLVLRRITTDRPVLASTQLTVDAATGRLRRRVVREHSRCACRALPGSATAPVVRRAAEPRTTTDSTGASPG